MILHQTETTERVTQLLQEGNPTQSVAKNSNLKRHAYKKNKHIYQLAYDMGWMSSEKPGEMVIIRSHCCYLSDRSWSQAKSVKADSDVFLDDSIIFPLLNL